MYASIFRQGSLKIIDELLKGERSLTELSTALKISKPTLHQRYLKDLLNAQVIRRKEYRTSKGKEVSYALEYFTVHLSIDPSMGTCISFMNHNGMDPEAFLVSQVAQTEFHEDLSKLVHGLIGTKGHRPDMLIMYGSIARGEGREKSDIDLLFLKEGWREEEKESIIDLLSRIALITTHQISPTLMTTQEFLKGSGRLFDEIRENGMVIYQGKSPEGRVWKELKRYRGISI
jgi:predicted nucleotidyltransferase